MKTRISYDYNRDIIFDKYGNAVRLHAVVERRIRRLIEGLKRAPEGYINMEQWTDDTVQYAKEALKAARANPCGTACCLAGKAGLMPEFRRLGFSWAPQSRAGAAGEARAFTVRPAVFFGSTVTQAVFIGSWAMDNIHTTEQAILVLEAFLDDISTALEDGEDWEPPTELRDLIENQRPDTKHFPVSGQTYEWCVPLQQFIPR